MNALFDKAIQALIWFLPGLLILLALILVFSHTDRRPRNKDSDKR